MVLPDLVPNTHDAMAMAEFARDVSIETHRGVHDALFEAHYGRGLDVGDRSVLLEVASAHGLDPEAVNAALDERRYDARLHEFGHLAAHLGVDSTPAALICNQVLIGSRPYGVLRDALERCLVRPETIETADAEETA